jgi:hypothetical protein
MFLASERKREREREQGRGGGKERKGERDQARHKVVDSPLLILLPLILRDSNIDKPRPNVGYIDERFYL